MLLKETVSRDFRLICLSKNSNWAPYEKKKSFNKNLRFREETSIREKRVSELLSSNIFAKPFSPVHGAQEKCYEPKK